MSRISDLAGFTTALSTTQDLSVGVITATSFSGDGSGLTGVASTDNIQTATEAEFLGGVKISGVTTTSGLVDINAGGQANSFKVEDLTSGRVVLSGTGGELEDSANLTFDGSNLVVSGNVSLGGTLTYQDVTNMDVLGIGTFQQGIKVLANGLDITGFSTFKTGVSVTGVVTATSFSGDGSALSGIEAGITTTEKTISANSTVFLGLSTAQHHTINLVAGITTIDCTGGSVGDSHSVVLINPSSVGTGVTVGFATDFLFPSGSTPSLPTGANDISLISFVVKQTGAGGTEVLASAGLNYSN